jgi:ABC-2 type transport system ATP-binding protein
MDGGRIVASGAPAELTAALASEYLLVDADDHARLRAELVALGREPSGDGPFRIDVGTREAHAVLKAIETPLTLVRTHAPSLEDAYLEIVSRAELGDEALGRAAEAAEEAETEPVEEAVHG